VTGINKTTDGVTLTYDPCVKRVVNKGRVACRLRTQETCCALKARQNVA
jgi:hypothetical protein